MNSSGFSGRFSSSSVITSLTYAVIPYLPPRPAPLTPRRSALHSPQRSVRTCSATARQCAATPAIGRKPPGDAWFQSPPWQSRGFPSGVSPFQVLLGRHALRINRSARKLRLHFSRLRAVFARGHCAAQSPAPSTIAHLSVPALWPRKAPKPACHNQLACCLVVPEADATAEGRPPPTPRPPATSSPTLRACLPGGSSRDKMPSRSCFLQQPSPREPLAGIRSRNRRSL